jgi:hypothetical protein
MKNSTLLLIPTSMCVTGLELLDCDRNRTQIINDYI